MFYSVGVMIQHTTVMSLCKCNKLVQLVVLVQYHVNVIYSLGDRDTHAHTHTHTHIHTHAHTHTHRHTDLTDKSNFKKPGEGWRAPGLTKT